MSKTVILGCGYVGWVLARRLIERGDPVRATTTTETKLSELNALGAEPLLLRPDDPSAFKEVLRDAEIVVHLAPPANNMSARDVVHSIRQSVSGKLRAYIYASTSGVFGNQPDPNAWVDETTEPQNVGESGRIRLDYERELVEAGLPARVLRIAGIYGPGRTLRESIQRDALILFEGQPPTSRIHIEDLVRLIEAMMEDRAPTMAIACDAEPATTLDVARYTCHLLGRTPPEPVPLEDAKRVLSPRALEMRLGGHKLRSIHRETLIGRLLFPTYREGVRASLEAEGVLLKN